MNTKSIAIAAACHSYRRVSRSARMVRGQGHCPNALRLLSSMSTITTGRTAESRGLVVWKKSKLLSLSSSSGRGSQTRMSRRIARRRRPTLLLEASACADRRRTFFIASSLWSRGCYALDQSHLPNRVRHCPGMTGSGFVKSAIILFHGMSASTGRAEASANRK